MVHVIHAILIVIVGYSRIQEAYVHHLSVVLCTSI